MYQKYGAGMPDSLKGRFHKTHQFKDYLQRYISSLHQFKDQLQMYLTLDVIGNPEATWEVLKYMESCGLKPLPVYHSRSDVKWLKRILDNYEYFCVGGMGGVKERFDYRPFGDATFKLICDKKGYPRARVHGLAMTGRLAARWPWYSVDSITWRYNAAMGHISVPFWWKGNVTIERVIVTDRRVHQNGHYLSVSPVLREYMDKIFAECDYTFKDMQESHLARSVVGIVLYDRMMQMIRKDWQDRVGFTGHHLYLAGDPLTNNQHRDCLIDVMQRKLVKELWGLETYWSSVMGKTTKKAIQVQKQFLGVTINASDDRRRVKIKTGVRERSSSR